MPRQDRMSAGRGRARRARVVHAGHVDAEAARALRGGAPARRASALGSADAGGGRARARRDGEARGEERARLPERAGRRHRRLPPRLGGPRLQRGRDGGRGHRARRPPRAPRAGERRRPRRALLARAAVQCGQRPAAAHDPGPARSAEAGPRPVPRGRDRTRGTQASRRHDPEADQPGRGEGQGRGDRRGCDPRAGAAHARRRATGEGARHAVQERAVSHRILVIDDEQGVRAALTQLLEYEGYEVRSATGGTEGIALYAQWRPQLTFLDVKMAGLDGLETLKRLRDQDARAMVVMISGHATIQNAVEATQLGAYDILEKPLDTDRILVTLRNAIGRFDLAEENERLKATIDSRFEIVGRSPAIRAVIDKIEKVAQTN